MTGFRGCAVALVTPFSADGEVDEAALRRLVDWQIERGIDAIVPCGTTGESATLSHDEHHRVMALVIEQVAGCVPVICGAGSNSTREAVSLSRKAQELGADAVLSLTPYYNKPTQPGLIRHYQTIAEEVDLPIIMYNVPGRTGVNMTAETTLRLAEVANIAGIKEASGDLGQVMDILRDRPEGFRVLSGDDALTLPMLSAGADGAISVVANEIPGDFTKLIHAGLDGDFELARELQYRYLALMQLNFVETNPIPVKAALQMMRLIEANYRLPLVPLQRQNHDRLASELERLGLLPDVPLAAAG